MLVKGAGALAGLFTGGVALVGDLAGFIELRLKAGNGPFARVNRRGGGLQS